MHNRAPHKHFFRSTFLCGIIITSFRRVVNDHQGADDEEEVEDKDIGDEELWIASKWVDLT